MTNTLECSVAILAFSVGAWVLFTFVNVFTTLTVWQDVKSRKANAFEGTAHVYTFSGTALVGNSSTFININTFAQISGCRETRVTYTLEGTIHVDATSVAAH
jgi:uncharacterized membrane protein YjfL (UPF0719 family)